MFSRVCLNRIRGVESFLRQSEWEMERQDHASSGPCDKGALQSVGSQEDLPVDGEVLYTIVAPLGTLEVSYELPDFPLG